MLLVASGECEKYGKSFRENYKAITEQEITLECANKDCKTTIRYCRECKKTGCPNCGGRLLDQFEKHPGMMF